MRRYLVKSNNDDSTLRRTLLFIAGPNATVRRIDDNLECITITTDYYRELLRDVIFNDDSYISPKLDTDNQVYESIRAAIIQHKINNDHKCVLWSEIDEILKNINSNEDIAKMARESNVGRLKMNHYVI